MACIASPMRGDSCPRAVFLAAAALLMLGAIDRATEASAQVGTETRHPGAEARISDTDNGAVIPVPRGTMIVLTLGSTYWMIADSPDPAVVESQGVARYGADRARCAPGMGCGSVSRTFVARAPGRVELSATRNACGEALACRPDQRNFRVTVVVRE